MVDSRPQSSAGVLTRSRDPWDGDLSPPPETLPRPFNAANHLINVRRYNPPPPSKTNYLSILYCRAPCYAFVYARLQLVRRSIKNLGEALQQEQRAGEMEFLEGGNLGGARRGGNCDRATLARQKPGADLFLPASPESSPSEAPGCSAPRHRFLCERDASWSLCRFSTHN